MPHLESLIDRLLNHHVEFVIIGGFAAVAHGVTLLTQDLDICCPFDPVNIIRIQKALSGIHPVHRMTPSRLPLQLNRRSCRGLKNLYLDTDIGPLDCLGRVAGLGDFEKVRAASMEVDWSGRACRLLTVKALITAKKTMGRPKDLETIRQLNALKRLAAESETTDGH